MEKQYVIFGLWDGEFGVAVDSVQEITELKKVRKIPNVPTYIEGIINLRGAITPIVNLKKWFNMEQNEENEEQASNRIIIIRIGEKQMGFTVDDASQVLRIQESEIVDPPEIIAGIERQYIVGITKLEEKMIILLDLERILSNQENEEKVL